MYIFRSFRMEEVTRSYALLCFLGSVHTANLTVPCPERPLLCSPAAGMGLRSSVACPYRITLKGERLFRVMEAKKLHPLFFFFFCKTLNVFLFG